MNMWVFGRPASPAWRQTRRWVLAHSGLFLGLALLSPHTTWQGRLIILLALLPALLITLQGWLVRPFRSALDWWGVSAVAAVGATVVVAAIASQAGGILAVLLWSVIVSGAQALLLPTWSLRGLWFLSILVAGSGTMLAWMTLTLAQPNQSSASGWLPVGGSILVYLLATGNAIWHWTNYAAPRIGPPMGMQIWGEPVND